MLTLDDIQRARIHAQAATAALESTPDEVLRDHLREAKNALDAHMEVYSRASVVGVDGKPVVSGGNPGRWDLESSWGALQRIQDDLANYTINRLRPFGRLQLPYRFFIAKKIINDYLLVSSTMPLVKEGATTKEDAAKYARLLVTYLSALAIISDALDHAVANNVYKTFQGQKFL